MAYGQTGSGKTHTMLGSHKNEDYNPSRDPHPDEGVIPRAARELFRYPHPEMMSMFSFICLLYVILQKYSLQLKVLDLKSWT